MTGLVRRAADADWLRSLGAEAVWGDVFDADGYGGRWRWPRPPW